MFSGCQSREIFLWIVFPVDVERTRVEIERAFPGNTGKVSDVSVVVIVHHYLKTVSYLVTSQEQARIDSPIGFDVDEKFKALLKAQTLNRSGKPLKTFKILSFKRIENRTIIKRIDLLDERTRDKTRFSVNAAALGLNLPANYFEVNSTDRNWDVVPREEFYHFY